MYTISKKVSLIVTFCACTGCNISTNIDESTKVIEKNTRIVAQNTQTIHNNVDLLQKNTKAIVENLKELKGSAEEIKTKTEKTEEIKPAPKKLENKVEKPQPPRNFLKETAEREKRTIDSTKEFFSNPYIVFLSAVIIGLMLFVPIYLIYLAFTRKSK